MIGRNSNVKGLFISDIIAGGGGGGHYGLTGRPIKNAKVPKKVRNGAQKSGMMTRNLEHSFFLPVIENYSDIQIIISNSALQCHLAAAFCFIINVA